MTMAAVSNGRTHLRDASFSSYLDTTDTDFVRSLSASIHGSSPIFTPSRRSSSSSSYPSPVQNQRTRGGGGELGVFGAESYFNEKLDHHDHHDHQEQPQESRTPSFKSVEDGDSKTTTRKSKSRTPSMRSESSWSSMDQTKPRKSLTGPWFLTGLQCKGSCYDVKPPVYTTNQSKTTTNNQRKGFWEDQVVQINLKKQTCHQKQERMLPTFDDPRKSIEVFGLHKKPAQKIQHQQDDAIDMSYIMEKSLSMQSWDAIPIKSQSKRYDDMESDASSDLFDIAVFPAEISSPVTQAYEPSEVSIEWSVVTASAAEFSASSDLEERQIGAKKKIPKAKELQKSIVNGGLIMGCRNDKAVKVANPSATTTTRRMASFPPIPPKKTQLESSPRAPRTIYMY